MTKLSIDKVAQTISDLAKASLDMDDFSQVYPVESEAATDSIPTAVLTPEAIDLSESSPTSEHGSGHKGGSGLRGGRASDSTVRGGGFRGGRLVDSAGSGGTGGGPPEGKGHDGGGEEATGNNLSFPLIVPEGVAPLTLRGSMGALNLTDPYFDTADEGGLYWFHQKAVGNEWQAQNTVWSGPLDVDKIDLGDALESARIELGRFVRIELALLKDIGDPEIVDDGWLGYRMEQIDGQGPDEVQGTPYTQSEYTLTFENADEAFALLGDTGVPIYRSDLASVYAPAGVMSLTIQKFTDGVTDPDSVTGLYWDGDGWVGPGIESENYAAQTNFGSELTVSGKVISGVSGKPFSFTEAGQYRITFEIAGGASIFLDAETEPYNVAGARLMEIVPDYVPAEGAEDIHNGLIYLDVMVPSSVSGDEGELDSQFLDIAPAEIA